MTLEQAREIERERQRAEREWTEHYLRDGRYAHGSWRAMTAREREAHETLAVNGVRLWQV